ncbi:hypothetical protein [Piscinibacter sp. XHJ-5]|uniref:hypothetical protein n=1 Tax=Piscinibacter sp. XHJ-5 TaxID=3037797 RepID=UPI002452953A|nr:hypothetical protein [Piscinibacter sp. XHJ-5]
MSVRSLLACTLLTGLALMAHAQTKSPLLEQPTTALDKSIVEAAFSKADLNGDGRVSKAEASQLPAIGARFVELDADKDGALALDEFAIGFLTTR